PRGEESVRLLCTSRKDHLHIEPGVSLRPVRADSRILPSLEKCRRETSRHGKTRKRVRPVLSQDNVSLAPYRLRMHVGKWFSASGPKCVWQCFLRNMRYI